MPHSAHHVAADVGAIVQASSDDARAGFVDLPGIASQAFRWPQVIANATVYRARIGLRREYRTQADALAYETGYSHPNIGWTPGTPAAQGAQDRRWGDAEKRQQLRDDERAEAGYDRMVYGSDE